MAAQANETLVRRFLEGVDHGNLDVIDEVFASNAQIHMPRAIHAAPLSRDEFKGFVGGMTTSFSEVRHDIEAFVSDGNEVVCRNTINAKHTGDFQGTPPTEKSVSWSAIGHCRVQDGQIAEMWVQADFLGLMQQVGAVPEVSAAS